MKRWAVGFISFFDNDLIIEIVESNSWHGAMSQHSRIAQYELDYTSRETATDSAFNQDAMVNVVEISS